MDGKKTLDIGQMVAMEMGGTVKDVNPDGTLKLSVPNPETGEETTKTFDLPTMMKDQGIDPTKINIRYNDPEEAVDGSNLSFATKLQLSLAGDDSKGALGVLADEYGEENVKMSSQGLVVKEKGVWKKADSSFMSDLASNTPEIAGGIAGRAAGMAIGTAVLPGVGTIAGGLIGGAVGSALATVIKDKGAEGAGIRTEYDAEKAQDVLSKELVWNLAIDSTLGAAGALWRGVGKPLVKSAHKASKSTVSAISRGDKSEAAQFFETMVPGTSRNDWLTTMRSPQDAKHVMKDMDRIVEWGKARANSSVIDPVDPLTNDLVRHSHGAMKLAKSRAMRQYGQGLEALEKSGATSNAKVDLTQTAADFKRTLGDLGLLYKDNAGELQLTRRARPGSEEIMQVFDPKSITTLGKIFDQMKTVTRTQTDNVLGELGPKKIVAKPLSFEDTKKLLSGIDDILETSGYYKGGDAAISNNARRALMKLRGQINERMIDALGDRPVRDSAGRMVKASDHYRNMAKKYSAFRDLYDDYAMPGKLGGSDQRAAATVTQMLGDKGANLEKSFQQMLEVSGVDANAIIPRMQQLRAARNLSDTYASSTGIGAIIKGQLGYGSPRAMAQTMAQQTMDRGTRSIRKVAPASPQHTSMVEATARGLDFVNKLPAVQKAKLVSTPILMREFGKTLLGAPQTQTQMQEQFMEQTGAE